MRYTLYALAAVAVYLWVWTALSSEYRHDVGQAGLSPFARIEALLNK